MNLLRDMEAAGLRLALTETGTIRVAGPDAELTHWTPIIRQNKPELAGLLKSWAELEAAIRDCCRARRDTPANLAALLADCRLEPADSWPGWREYFDGETSKWTH